MNTPVCQRTIALAGLFQAARLVQQTATGKGRNEAATTASLNSIFNTEPESVEAVYVDYSNIATGLAVLTDQLGNRRRDLDLTRYVLLLLHLERKLSSNPGLLEKIRSGIDAARHQVEFFELRHPTVIASLAEIYRQTISRLKPRIMVNG
ncbi:MAG: DUF489 family protein, partial [Gammaproteobacteria bacterium]